MHAFFDKLWDYTEYTLIPSRPIILQNCSLKAIKLRKYLGKDSKGLQIDFPCDDPGFWVQKSEHPNLKVIKNVISASSTVFP